MDEDKDHLCDICEKQVSKCADSDKDHMCDTCGKQVNECADSDKDHLCDICEKQVSACVDADKDYICDICGKQLGNSADYTTLDKTIADSDALDLGLYKNDDNMTAFKDALAAAKAVARDLKEDQQSTIDNAAKALNDAIAALQPAGRSSGGGGASTVYRVFVTKADNGDLTVSTKGKSATLTPAPDAGYSLLSISAVDKKGGAVKVTENKNGTYSLTIANSNVYVTAVFEKIDDGTCPRDNACPIDRFTDTENDKWWHDGIHYCLDNKLMNGFPDGTFQPNTPVSRGQLVTILYRHAGEPDFQNGSTFSDVKDGEYYVDAVGWASQQTYDADRPDEYLVNGYDDTFFGPDDDITREQLAAILWRYAQYLDLDVSVKGDLSVFKDAEKVSGYAEDAMQWACGVEILQGDNGSLKPQGNATRAEAAAMLQRFCENVVK